MSDIEIIRLCASALGFEVSHESNWMPDGCLEFVPCLFARDNPRLKWGPFDPLHDDEQAMAMVKEFRIYLDPDFGLQEWQAATHDTDAVNADLNRAICECVAKMHGAAKGGIGEEAI